jgi:hypothetical protein
MKLIDILACFLGLQLLDPGPMTYGFCQTGCHGIAVACYAAADYTFGTVTAGFGVPAANIQRNSSLGFCMAAGFAPTP